MAHAAVSKEKSADWGFDDATATPVELVFRNCSHVIRKKAKGVKTEKQLLEGLTSSVKGGEMLAIVGPSGAGKTMLMRLLTLSTEVPGDKTGEVLLNGSPLTASMFLKYCAFVPQQDTLWTFLSCREHFEFALRFFQAGKTAEEYTTITNTLLHKLGLDNCADTRAGNELIPGLSGGQRRRLSFAMGLVKMPRVLFLDEPTSGLDAAAAASIVQLLKSVGMATKCAIVCTIHQPSSSVFAQFDKCLLLSSGKAAYEGPTSELAAHFAAIGQPLPAGYNVADWALEKVNGDFADQADVDKIIAQWANRNSKDKDGGGGEHKSEPIGTHASTGEVTERGELQLSGNAKRASFCAATWHMQRKLGALTLKDPLLYLGRCVIFTVGLSFFALVYIKARDKVQEQIQNRLFLLMWFTGVSTQLCVVAVFALNAEAKAIRREIRDGMYHAGSYLIAHSVLQLPMMAILSVFALGIPGYAICTYNGDVFLTMVLVMTCFLWAYECMAHFFAVNDNNPLMGMMNFVNLWFMAFLFCGIMLPIDDVPWPLKFFCYVLPHKYVLTALVRTEYFYNEFKGAVTCTPNEMFNHSSSVYRCGPGGFYCPDAVSQVRCYGKSGADVLKTLSYTFDSLGPEDTVAQDCGILLLQVAFWKLATVIRVLFSGSLAPTVKPGKTAGNADASAIAPVE